MEKLKKDFKNKDELVSYVKKLSPFSEGETSSILGGKQKAKELLKEIDPINYGKTRNYGHGKITKLSAYISHGILSLNEVRNHGLNMSSQPEQITSFIQELAWRDFWERVAQNNPHWIWEDIEEYKTGFLPKDYSDTLPLDITKGKTGVGVIDYFIQELLENGYVHNHGRMYLASYIVHFRKIKWQVGAKWFLNHLLDAQESSNNFSWQWVASTFSNKPYIFNLENVKKYFHTIVDTSKENNKILDRTYEEISAELFPFLKTKGELDG